MSDIGFRGVHNLLVCGLAILLCTISQAAEPLPDLSKGGLIELDAVEYEADGDYNPPPNKPLVLRGKGVGLTKITLKAGAEKFLTIAGREKDEQLSRNTRWEIRDLVIDGGKNQADGILLEHATGGSLHNVIVQEFRGSAMRVKASWDCYFSNCRFVRCGTERRVAWHAADADTEPPAGSNVNNFVFVGCIWENNDGPAFLYLGRGSTKNRFLGCKWHGKLPADRDSDHIHCYGFDNAWDSCNFTNAGRSHIVMFPGSEDNSFSGCHIGNTKTGWGIELNGTRQNLEGVVWSTRYGRSSRGDIRE